MARIWTSGFELNSTTANMEFTTASGTIASSGARNGTYCGAVTSAVSGTFKGFGYQFVSANAVGPYWFRFYLNITSLPNANTTISEFQQSGGSANLSVLLTTTGTLELFTTNGATQIGSASPALSTGQWYRIELKMDDSPASGSKVGELQVNGVVVATSSTLTSTNYTAGVDEVFVGVNIIGESCTTVNIQFDDLALNDSTGSFQTSYPGDGNVIRYLPSATGDSNAWTAAVGGTAGQANNFTRVNQVTPDDATTYNDSIIANQSDLYICAIQSGTLPVGSTINVVQVGARIANITAADTTAALKLQIEQKASGTVSQSAAIIPDTLTWSTNSKALPHNYPLTLYQDPTGTNWTTVTIGTMQIGMICSTAHTDPVCVTDIWAYVDFSAAPIGIDVGPLNNTLGANISQAVKRAGHY